MCGPVSVCPNIVVRVAQIAAAGQTTHVLHRRRECVVVASIAYARFSCLSNRLLHAGIAKDQ